MIDKNLRIKCRQPCLGALSSLIHSTKAPNIQIDLAVAGPPHEKELLLFAFANISGHQFPHQNGLAFYGHKISDFTHFVLNSEESLVLLLYLDRLLV